MRTAPFLAALALILPALAGAQAVKSEPLLTRVQQVVNLRVKFTPESGNHDYWRVATTWGDCEDIALSKRKELIKLGWPEDDLRIIILILPDRSGHATLYVPSRNLVLDNTPEFTYWPVALETFEKATGAKMYCTVEDISQGDKPASKRCAPRVAATKGN